MVCVTTEMCMAQIHLFLDLQLYFRIVRAFQCGLVAADTSLGIQGRYGDRSAVRTLVFGVR